MHDSFSRCSIFANVILGTTKKNYHQLNNNNNDLRITVLALVRVWPSADDHYEVISGVN